ncbi:MAG: hypothetical protein CML41_02220 [Rhodobacteraceae bacterium]|nr:hypothetical protein [Paracoccaceae bacterium]
MVGNSAFESRLSPDETIVIGLKSLRFFGRGPFLAILVFLGENRATTSRVAGVVTVSTLVVSEDTTVSDMVSESVAERAVLATVAVGVECSHDEYLVLWLNTYPFNVKKTLNFCENLWSSYDKVSY